MSYLSDDGFYLKFKECNNGIAIVCKKCNEVVIIKPLMNKQ